MEQHSEVVKKGELERKKKMRERNDKHCNVRMHLSAFTIHLGVLEEKSCHSNNWELKEKIHGVDILPPLLLNPEVHQDSDIYFYLAFTISHPLEFI